MFDFSQRSESRDPEEKFNEWLEKCGDCDVLIEGAGISALCAGIELQESELKVLLVTGADAPGGVLLEGRGPVEILSPADELLEELGYPVETNPPLWIDRLELLAFLTNKFFKLGGEILNSVTFENFSRPGGENFKLDLTLNGRALVVEALQLISTRARKSQELSEITCRQLMEKIVLQTSKTDEGFIKAGFRACSSAGQREHFCPLINAFVLSGRKAVRLLLADK